MSFITQCFCPPPDDPFTRILKIAIADQEPPNPSKREMDEVWDFVDEDHNDLLDDGEIVDLMKNYLQIQDAVLAKYPKPKRKHFKQKQLTPGLDLGDLILKHEKLRSRRHLYAHLQKNEKKVIGFFKRLFGLTTEQRLTNAVFRGKGKMVLFQPWTLPKNIRKFALKKSGAPAVGAFDFDPENFEDPKIQEAFKNTHIQYAFKPVSHAAALKLIRSTLRKLGKVDNLGLPTQQYSEEELKQKKQLEESSWWSIPEIRDTLRNNSPYKNGTIVEVFSASQGDWVFGEIIGAKSEHAVNVRYMKQSKFLDPSDLSKFRLIEKVVGTPYGIGFLQKIRHEDYFCTVALDWCNVSVTGSQVQSIQVQTIDHLKNLVQDDEQQEVKGQLLIKVVNAVELPKLDIGGACDPFVEVSIPCRMGSDERKKKTKIIRRNQNPKFDQVLDFKDFIMNENDETRGMVEVFDADEGANELIGRAEFKLPTRNDAVEDYIVDIRLPDGTHRGVVVLQSLLIREELTASAKKRMQENFTKRLGDVVRRKKRKSRK